MIIDTRPVQILDFSFQCFSFLAARVLGVVLARL